jgi:hypothetical protein
MLTCFDSESCKRFDKIDEKKLKARGKSSLSQFVLKIYKVENGYPRFSHLLSSISTKTTGPPIGSEYWRNN